MIRCGWCNGETEPGSCSTCGRDPALPWLQRATEPPQVSQADRFRARLSDAAAELEAAGLRPTAERLAERLDISPRTVRRWREMTS